MKVYGYVRVSSKDQNPERQIHALTELDIPRKQIYIDTVSGKDFHRPAYQRMLQVIKENDLVVIKSIDRLGRNYAEIQEQWKLLTRKKKVHMRVLDIPLLNTTTAQSDLTATFIADLVLQILAYVAETERSYIKQRQREGIALALARGVKFGKPRIFIGEEFQDYYQAWKRKEISSEEAAKRLGISKSTFYRRCREIDRE